MTERFGDLVHVDVEAAREEWAAAFLGSSILSRPSMESTSLDD
jgi:hypothetical protein